MHLGHLAAELRIVTRAAWATGRIAEATTRWSKSLRQLGLVCSGRAIRSIHWQPSHSASRDRFCQSSQVLLVPLVHTVNNTIEESVVLDFCTEAFFVAESWRWAWIKARRVAS